MLLLCIANLVAAAGEGRGEGEGIVGSVREGRNLGRGNSLIHPPNPRASPLSYLPLQPHASIPSRTPCLTPPLAPPPLYPYPLP